MDARDFLRLADVLVAGSTEAEWRSAVSRAYYGAFHVARGLLTRCGFSVPRGEQAHAYLWLRLSNSKHVEASAAGANLAILRRDRNRADYDIDRPLRQATANVQVQTAQQIIRVLEGVEQEPTRAILTDAIRTYERDVLKEVTWQS